ncbi:MAG: hypothetical protein WAM95_10085 [Bacillus sp. (in: firmicutes)]
MLEFFQLVIIPAIMGLTVGLSATGLYSGSKHVFTTSGKQPGKK